MKKLIILVFVAASALVLATGCDTILGILSPNSGKDNASTETYADTVVNSFIGQLTAGNSRALSRSMVYSLSPSQITLIKTKAIAQIKADNLYSSNKIDLILVSMLDGVKTAVVTINQTGDATVVLAVAAKSAVISIGSADPSVNFSASAVDAKGIVATITAKAIDVVVSVAPSTAASAMKAEVISQAVEGIDKATRLTTSAPAVVHAIVVTVVNKTVSAKTGSADYKPDDLAAMVRAATDAAYTWSTADKAGMAGAIASAAAEQVCTKVTDTVEAKKLFSRIAECVTSSNADAEDLISTELSNAIANAANAVKTGSADAATIGAVITAVKKETSPVALATAKVQSSAVSPVPTLAVSSAGTVVLVSSGSTAGTLDTSTSIAAPYDVSWDAMSLGAPEPTAVAGSATQDYSVSITLPGTYTYRLTIQNQGGAKSSSAVVNIIASWTLKAADSYNVAMQALIRKDYNTARTTFDAIAADTNNSDKNTASVWSAFLGMAALSVNPDIVSLMQTNIGMAGYPSDLNTLLGDTWFNQQWYESKLGFVDYGTVSAAQTAHLTEYFVRCDLNALLTVNPIYSYTAASGPKTGSDNGGFVGWNNDGTYYVRFHPEPDANGYVYASVNGTKLTSMPPLTARAFVRYDNLVDLTQPWGYLPTMNAPSWAASLVKYQGLSASAYPLYALANIINSNPAGFNAMVDKVLSGALGADFDAAVAKLKILDTTSAVIVPADLIKAFSSSGMTTTMPTTMPTIILDKPLLLAFAGAMEMLKGLVQYVASYDFSVDLTALNASTRDGIFGGLASTTGTYGGIPPLAKQAMQAYPNGLVGTNLLKDHSQPTRDNSRASIATGIQDIHDAAVGIADNFTSGDYNSYLPTGSLMPDGTPLTGKAIADQLITPYLASAQNLHEAIMTSATPFTLSIPTGGGSSPMTVTAYPGVIFDSTGKAGVAYFSLQNIFEFDGTGKKLKLYMLDATYDGVRHSWTNNSITYDETKLTGSATSTVYQGLAIKLNLANLEKLYPDLGTTLENMGDPVLALGGIPVYTVNTDTTGTNVVYSPFNPNDTPLLFTWMFGYGAPK